MKRLDIIIRVSRMAIGAAVLGMMAQDAYASITTLKQVQISNGSQIDLLFDGKVQKGQVRTEFINDIIQLSIQDVSVYPAKISSVNGGNLTKIFAYQYAPKLVRCRLTVKGKAEDYKDKLEIKAGGKILTVRMQDGSHASTAAASAPATASNSVKGHAIEDIEERALLSRVMAADPAQAAPAKTAPAKTAAEKPARDSITLSSAAPAAAAAGSEGSPNTENLPIHLTGNANGKLAGGKPLPSPLKAFGKMGIVLGLFGLFAYGLKRYAQGKSNARLGNKGASALAEAAGGGGWMGAVSRMAKKGLGRNPKMIEVLSTHYLGPKKSIAVVRVAGRMLVLGVSNESINLITQLSGDEADPLGAAMDGLDLGELGVFDNAPARAAAPAKAKAPAAKPASGATVAGDAVFSDLLHAERAKPQFANPSAASAYGVKPATAGGNAPVIPGASSGSLSSVRAQIRNRLEGLKQL
jgi:flagellar biogenesis protein FliO